ncbi:hypothetical protein Drorol1_Dr00024669 [Drosera rotundifolia]
MSGGVSADTGEVGSSDKIDMLCINGVASASVDTIQSDKPEGSGINDSNSDGDSLIFLSTDVSALQLDAPISTRSAQDSSVDAVLSSEEHNSEMSSSSLQNDDLSLTEDLRVDSYDDLDDSGKAIMLDIPLPLKNSDGSVVHVGEELGLGMTESAKLNSVLSDVAEKIDLWTIGYIRLLKVYVETESDHFLPDDDRYEWVPLSMEFGVPVFSPKLCECICKRVTSSQLLQTESFNKHHEAMQSLRKQLREICAEYSATGPNAKLLYQKEKPKDSSRQLMNYASGRWNPLMDPSSPISGISSEHQRLRLATRQRSRREVLSFDGRILRSYALTLVYEAATRPIDELAPLGTTKAEAEDADSKEVTFPGVNLLFDGSELHPFDIGALLISLNSIL